MIRSLFLEVAHWGSLRKAAQALHVSVSSIDRQILRAEEELENPDYRIPIREGCDEPSAAVVEMPWCLGVLEVSHPLHLGDCGGLPLKVLWALLDIITIVVFGEHFVAWIALAATVGTAAWLVC